MIIAMAVAVLVGQYTQAEAQSLFAEANTAHASGDYATAQARLEKLVASGMGGADVLYNLGTAYLNQGQLGPAALYLERAKRAGGGRDIDFNLSLVRDRQGDSVIGAANATPFTQRLAEATDERTVTVAAVLTWWGAFAFWWAWRAVRRYRGALLAGTILAFTAAFVLAVAAINAGWVRSHVVEAIVMVPDVKVFDLPQALGKASFEMHAGLKVRVMESTNGFTRIRLPNAVEGWATSAALTIL